MRTGNVTADETDSRLQSLERDFDSFSSAAYVAAPQPNGADFSCAVKVCSAAGSFSDAFDSPDSSFCGFIRKGALDWVILDDDPVHQLRRVGKNRCDGAIPEKVDAGLLGRNVRADLLGRSVTRLHRPENQFGREVEPHEGETTGTVDFDRHCVACLEAVTVGKRIENFRPDLLCFQHFKAADCALVGLLAAREGEEDRLFERDGVVVHARHRRGEGGAVRIIPEDLFDGHDRADGENWSERGVLFLRV